MTKQDLMRHLEAEDIFISDRTFYSDIEHMRYNTKLAWFAPIEFCTVRQAYYYKVPGYSISKVHLTDELRQALILMHHIFEQCDNSFSILNIALPLFQALTRLFNATLPELDVSSPILEFQSTSSSKIKFLPELTDAIMNRKALNVQLGTFRNPRRQSDFHPYKLKEVNHEWFAVGYLEKYKKVGSIRLSAIGTLQESDREYQREKSAEQLEAVDVFQYLWC